MYVNGTLTAFNPDSYALASSPSRFIEIVTFCFSVVRIHSGNDFPRKAKTRNKSNEIIYADLGLAGTSAFTCLV